MMIVQELNPDRLYVVILPANVLREELGRVKELFAAHGVDVIVLAGEVSVQEQKGYWGLYCPQCGVWWIDPDGKRLTFYPAPEIAQAHLEDKGWFRPVAHHLWQVQKFGEEAYTGYPKEPGAAVCPLIHEKALAAS